MFGVTLPKYYPEQREDTQDLMFLNQPAYIASDVRDYMTPMKAIDGGVVREIIALARNFKGLRYRLKALPKRYPLNTRFWGVAFFRLGDMAVKYLLRPVPDWIRSPLRVTAQTMRSATAHLTLVWRCASSSVDWMICREPEFVPTGDRGATNRRGRVGVVDGTIGALMIPVAIYTVAPCLLAVGVALVLAPTMAKDDLKTSFTQALVIVPILLTLLAVASTPVSAFAAAGALAGMSVQYH
jgi:hypothetical protein